MAYSELCLIYSEAIADRRARAMAERSASAVPTTELTVFGCGQDEAALFQEMGARLGVSPTITEAAVCETNAELARGNRCISVNHKTQVTNSTLMALSKAGVEYISTRSIGYNHIDLKYAERVGISVGNLAYSPDSVADYTLMLMLMAVRHAKSNIRRTDSHDYRLSDTRGKELRDLTVGVIGTGRIGTAVIDRLRGFGSRVLAHDNRRQPCADYVPLDELLQQSDIVTLHTPLTADTHHLLNRQRIERMKPGAYIVNTGRGPLLDTEPCRLVRSLICVFWNAAHYHRPSRRIKVKIWNLSDSTGSCMPIPPIVRTDAVSSLNMVTATSRTTIFVPRCHLAHGVPGRPLMFAPVCRPTSTPAMPDRSRPAASRSGRA